MCVCVLICPADLVCLLYLCLLLFTPEGSRERLHLNTEITAMPDSDNRSQRAAAFSSPPLTAEAQYSNIAWTWVTVGKGNTGKWGFFVGFFFAGKCESFG